MLQNFAKADYTAGTGDYTAGNTYKAFNELFPPTAGEATMWDELISKSLDNGLGTAHTDADLDTFRTYGVTKGLLGAAIYEALNLLDKALAAGPSAAAQDHVDKAWAVYYGSREGGAYSGAEVTKKRESSGDFGDTGLNVFSRLDFAFKQTRDGLAATGGNANAAADGVKLIKKMIILTFARATIKYSHNRKTADGYSAGAHMEGDAYYRIFAGVALSFLENDADAKTKLDAISAIMSYTLAEAAITVKDHHCEAKKKVEEMYVDLELDCDMVGVKESLPTDCPTDCWTNMGKEHYFYIPQSDVFDIGELSLDVNAMKSESASPHDWTAATTTYTDGLNSAFSVKSVAIRDDAGQMFFDGFHQLTGSKTSFDDIISAALGDTGDFTAKDASYKDSFRYYAVAKCGIAALQLQTMYLLEKALTDAAAGTAGAADLWDQAYAVFVGVTGGASGTVGQLESQGGGKGVMQKRDADYPAPALQARDHVMKHFAAGQKAILAATYDATAATAAADEIRRLIGITFARATLKYSSTMKNVGGDPYSATYHAEGFCYWRAMAGWMSAKADMKATALEIDALMALSKNDADIAQPATHCDVKQKLESMLPGMGISCDDIGVPKESLALHSCTATCAENAVPATPSPTPAPTPVPTVPATPVPTPAPTPVPTEDTPESRAPVAALGAFVAALVLA